MKLELPPTVNLTITNCRAARISERSEAIDRCLLELRRYTYIRHMYRTQHVTVHVTPSHDGSSLRGCFCSCSAAHLCQHAPAEGGHRRKADGNGNDAAASSTLRGPRCKTVRAT